MTNYRYSVLFGIVVAIASVGCSENPAPSPQQPAQKPANASNEPKTPAPDVTNAAMSQAVADIEKLGGKVTADPNRPDKPITKIALAKLKLTDKQLEALAAFKGLEELDLGDNRQITDDGLVQLKDMDQLTKLRLANLSITGEGLVHISGLGQLEHINLALCNLLRDEGLSHLSGLTNLKHLDLASTGVTDDGVLSLKLLTQLEWLNLQNVPLTDTGLAALHGLTNLESLGLKGTEVTDVGVQKLQESLPGLQKITR